MRKPNEIKDEIFIARVYLDTLKQMNFCIFLSQYLYHDHSNPDPAFVSDADKPADALVFSDVEN